MCGIVGYLDLRRSTGAAAAADLVERMAATLTHRGPDHCGVWIDADVGIGLGHRRLSIIDLSPLGHQPMLSPDGRYAITYNGEVYNFRELRLELERAGVRFQGGSDTEVMLAAFSTWGAERAIERFAGMFAFALWDRRERKLRLVRDRLGVKPLYWTLRDGLLLFGSELKALMVHPNWRGDIDRDAAAEFLRYSYVPGPATIFRGVQKLRPGTILTIGMDGEARLAPFWALRNAIERTCTEPLISESEGLDRLGELLTTAVRQRMISDVPLGAFLSGGIDSSLVVAVMQAQSSRKVRTFSIGFDDKRYDEAPYARAVARHLGTDHTELYISPESALALVPRLPEMFDEPFADSSQIPTYFVAATTRRHVTVALSGDGGDELFAGYPRYRLAAALWRRIGLLPRPVRRVLGTTLRALPEPILRTFLAGLPKRFRLNNPGDKLRRMAFAIGERDADAMQGVLAAVWPEGGGCVQGASARTGAVPLVEAPAALIDLVSRMQYHDTLAYLPDDILQKVDRCSMAVSLEARAPLVDHRLVEFVWSLPPHFKLRGGESKWLLRRLLDRYLPRPLVERPKMGFSTPIGAWLRGPLRDWAQDLLDPVRLGRDQLLDAARVERLWREHQSGHADREIPLWNLLMLRAWQLHWRVS